MTKYQHSSIRHVDGALSISYSANYELTNSQRILLRTDIVHEKKKNFGLTKLNNHTLREHPAHQGKENK